MNTVLRILPRALATFALVSASSPLPARAANPPPEAAWSALAPHPRLFADAKRLGEVRVQEDEVSRQLTRLVRWQAERWLQTPPVDYPATGIILMQVREAQGCIVACALTYRLTGETVFLERARTELLRLCALPEWRLSHFLGVGEAALAAGIGYDWLHADLTADERTRVARALVQNAIEPYFTVPKGGDSWVEGDFNWTQVCHAGVVAGALAIAEREPELARRVVAHATANFDRVGASYAPDGGHAEGPSYWSYGTTFHVILVEALRTALGTGCRLERYPGFLLTGDYRNQMIGPTGEDFNYADYHDERLNEPVLFWFARENRNRSIARDEFGRLDRLERLARAHPPATRAAPGPPPGADPELAPSRHLPFQLLWWDPTLPDSAEAPPLHWTASGTLPLAVMRSAWDDRTASFLAIKGGTPHHSHAHMDAGSFVLEADGVRWALDLGTENYNRMRAARIDLWNYTQTSSRWTVFRAGPEAHNILRFDAAPQHTDGKAEIRALSPLPDKTVGNVVALTPLYAGQVAQVTRTVKLHPDRTFTISDEWTAAARPTTATWQWLTRATVTRTSDGLRLTQAGQSLALRIETNPAPNAATAAALTIATEDVSAPRGPQDSANPGLRSIVVSIPTAAHANVQLHVTATPGSVSR